MEFNLLQDPPLPLPLPRAARSGGRAWRVCVVAARVAFAALLMLSALLNIFTSLHLAPVVDKVNSIFERADVLFYTVYQLGCNYSHFIPPNQCAKL